MPKIVALPGKAVIIINQPEETLTPGGIIIPSTVKDENGIGFVVASGIPDVEPGDTVLLSGKYAGSSFVIDKQEYVAVEQDEVLAVLGEGL